MTSWPTPAGARFGVFTLLEALDAGWTVDAIRYAVDVGTLTRLRRACFAPPAPAELSEFEAADLDLVRRTVAATLASRDTHGSHLGAALVVGLPVWAPEPQVCVTTRRDCALVGVHVHHAQPRPGHFGVVGGVAVTALERTIVDVAREYGAEAALVIADAAVRRGLTTVDDLARMVDVLGHDLDVCAARDVLRLVDPAAESPLESRSRWQFDVFDIPQPLTQVDIFTTGGRFLGRTDFYWPEGVVGEVDGMSKYETREVLGREKWRQEGLETVELGVVRWGSAHLRDFAPSAARIQRARARAVARPGEREWVAVHPELLVR